MKMPNSFCRGANKNAEPENNGLKITDLKITDIKMTDIKMTD